MSIKPIIVAFFILCSLTGFTQEKHLKKKEVLQKIILEIEKNYPENKSLHFYLIKEVDTSFTEAEFCFNSKEYNLKFLGDSLVETEIGIEFEDIPENIQSLIRKQLHSDFEKYKIKLG